MGNYPPNVPQWTEDDLARAEAAKDTQAINAARRAGSLRDLMTPPPEPDTDPAA